MFLFLHFQLYSVAAVPAWGHSVDEGSWRKLQWDWLCLQSGRESPTALLTKKMIEALGTHTKLVFNMNMNYNQTDSALDCDTLGGLHGYNNLRIFTCSSRTNKITLVTCSLAGGSLCGSSVSTVRSSTMACKCVTSPSMAISTFWKGQQGGTNYNATASGEREQREAFVLGVTRGKCPSPPQAGAC